MGLTLQNLLIGLTVISTLSLAAPTTKCLADPSCGPIPGESSIYSDQTSISAPWPANTTGAVLNTTSAAPGTDDLLFQNLLAAEWIIFNFYQQGVEQFNQSAFVEAGFPNTTYAAIREIRNNEAGHLRIFQNQISSGSIKPGPCKYQYPFTDPASYLALQTIIEVASMAFLTGLELQAKLDASRGALVAIAATESRHNTWALMSSWRTDPFAGPADTYFPYANQVLEIIREWVVDGSCPTENPVYPYPRQDLPTLSARNGTTSIAPGALISFDVSGGKPVSYEDGKDYFAVFFHGVLNVSMPFDIHNGSTIIPSQFEEKGIIIVTIADEEGAPTAESTITKPLFLLEEPAVIGLEAVHYT